MLFKYKNNLVLFICCISIVFLLLLIAVKSINIDIKHNNKDFYTSIIDYSDDNTNIYVEYPRFKSDKLNKYVTNIIYNYIKSFKKNNNSKSLNIKYDLIRINEYINIQFYINNSLNNDSFKNIILNTNLEKIAYINDIYNENNLKELIINKVYNTYSNDIKDEILNKSINNNTYIINNNKLDIYFNNIDNLIPKIEIDLNELITNK